MATHANICGVLMNAQFGPYLLEAHIGEGSLAEVYRARTAGGAVVALKRISRAHLSTSALREVFSTECDIATQISGPRLLGATDKGTVDDWPYLVMPLAPGGSLASLLGSEAGYKRSDLGALATHLGEALGSLHAIGYLHCDLSPSNILFTKAEGGDSLLSDFSAATRLGSRQEEVRGTFCYMSPEQVRGQVLGPRSDIFSLGVLLWQCVTGEKIFERDAQHLSFMAVVEAQPPKMSGQPAKLESVLLKALAKDPTERYETPEQLCVDFSAAL